MKKTAKNYYTILIIMLFTVILYCNCAFALPVLNFSDINSGPNKGNTDGIGDGAIVTIWGNNLGSNQGTSKIFVGEVEATSVYYWKNADGSLPGGPADLQTYHQMQEIAFSIPEGANDGNNTIMVRVNNINSNTIPFTVRSGNIYFIKPTGNDSTGNGSWSRPWLSLNNVFSGGNGKLSPGDVVYAVGVNSTEGIKIGGDGQVAGTELMPISMIAYPNNSVSVSGSGGDSSVINNWYPSNRNNAFINISKMKITCYGNDGESPHGISVFPGNRIVGVEITGPSVYGGYGGAITGTAGVPDGGVYLGIYIHDYGYQSKIEGKNNYSYTYSDDDDTWTSPPYDGIGDSCTNCTSADRFQHLYYISNRTTTLKDAYEIGWNYLVNNPILHGIHIYDMGDAAGWNGTMKIHHNVVKNQRGGAIDISYPATCPVEIHDNIVIYDTDTKLQGVPFRILGNGNTKIYNNTIYGWNIASHINSSSDDFKNNIMVDRNGIKYFSNEPSQYSNNLFYSESSASPSLPSFFSSDNGDVNSNPLFVDKSNSDYSLGNSSLAKNSGTESTIEIAPRDFFGNDRASKSQISIGAINHVIDSPINLRVFQ